MYKITTIVLAVFINLFILFDLSASELKIGYSYGRSTAVGYTAWSYRWLHQLDDQGYSHPVGPAWYQFDTEILGTCPGYKVALTLSFGKNKSYSFFFTHEFQSFTVETNRHIIHSEIANQENQDPSQPLELPSNLLPGTINKYTQRVLYSNSSAGISFYLPHNMALRLAIGAGATDISVSVLHASSQYAIQFFKKRFEGVLEFRYYKGTGDNDEGFKPSGYQVTLGLNLCITRSNRKINWLLHGIGGILCYVPTAIMSGD